ncbi:uncharacterized protein NPIL_427101 [Nephila pilipes]|uniref:Uncharacterized protein n=1 Tax=Nephila pilipes TaxID=299642 RepID=A0A8X6UJM2_NEPPI|nr:uncharacterized protein NPIL_427101 [Nephila pilipes]
MNLKGLGKETVNLGLFGGIERAEKHQKYHINLSNVDGSYNCELEVLDEKKICASLPRMNHDNCLKQLKDLGTQNLELDYGSTTPMGIGDCRCEKSLFMQRYRLLIDVQHRAILADNTRIKLS